MALEAEPYEPIRIETHRDFRRHTRAICRRFNDNPELARLVLVNPILAMEDAGVVISAEMKEHIMHRLRFPPKLEERIKRLETELAGELKALGFSPELPLSAEDRARLLHDVLKVPPEPEQPLQRRRLARTRTYREAYPLAAKLAEYERARQGALIFHRREIYESYKSGERRHHWLRSIRFKV